MTTAKFKRAFAYVLALCSLLLSSFWAVDYFRFDGIVIQGLISDLGEVKRGAVFERRVDISNFTSRSVQMTFIPGCGCEQVRIRRFEVRPFSYTTIPIRFQLSKQLNGHIVRSFRLIYKTHGKIRTLDGKVRVEIT